MAKPSLKQLKTLKNSLKLYLKKKGQKQLKMDEHS